MNPVVGLLLLFFIYLGITKYWIKLVESFNGRIIYFFKELVIVVKKVLNMSK